MSRRSLSPTSLLHLVQFSEPRLRWLPSHPHPLFPSVGAYFLLEVSYLYPLQLRTSSCAESSIAILTSAGDRSARCCTLHAPHVPSITVKALTPVTSSRGRLGSFLCPVLLLAPSPLRSHRGLIGVQVAGSQILRLSGSPLQPGMSGASVRCRISHRSQTLCLCQVQLSCQSQLSFDALLLLKPPDYLPSSLGSLSCCS